MIEDDDLGYPSSSVRGETIDHEEFGQSLLSRCYVFDTILFRRAIVNDNLKCVAKMLRNFSIVFFDVSVEHPSTLNVSQPTPSNYEQEKDQRSPNEALAWPLPWVEWSSRT